MTTGTITNKPTSFFLTESFVTKEKKMKEDEETKEKKMKEDEEKIKQ